LAASFDGLMPRPGKISPLQIIINNDKEFSEEADMLESSEFFIALFCGLLPKPLKI
jgi:hypothetical protein